MSHMSNLDIDRNNRSGRPRSWSQPYQPTGPAPDNFRHLNCGYLEPELKATLKKEYHIKWYDEPIKGWYVGDHLHEEVLPLCPPPKIPRVEWTRIDDIVSRDQMDAVKSLLGRDFGWAPIVNPDEMDKLKGFLASCA